VEALASVAAVLVAMDDGERRRGCGVEVVKHAALIALMIIGVAVFVYLAGFARS
jgi:hypothetical protein